MTFEDWLGVITVVALALDHMRGRKLDDTVVGRLWEVRRELAEQTRRVDKLFEDARALETRMSNAEGQLDDEQGNQNTPGTTCSASSVSADSPPS